MTDSPPIITEALQSYFASRIDELSSMRLSIMNESNKNEEQLAELKLRLSAVEERDQQLKEQEQQLSKERTGFEEECKVERAELARQWQQLRDEITRMEEMNNIQKVGANWQLRMYCIIPNSPDVYHQNNRIEVGGGGGDVFGCGEFQTHENMKNVCSD